MANILAAADPPRPSLAYIAVNDSYFAFIKGESKARLQLIFLSHGDIRRNDRRLTYINIVHDCALF
jgi:hypothetical protein